MERIKIAYAIDKETGQPVHISKADKSKKYLCIECKEELRPAQGKERAHHFKHKKNSQCNTSPETELHKLAKIIIEQNNEILLYEKVKFNYNKCDIEKQIRDIRPDVIIENNEGEKWIIEICVTHAIDEEKKKKIQEMQLNCIEIALDKDLYGKALNVIKNEVLQNPNNRTKIYPEDSPFPHNVEFNTKTGFNHKEKKSLFNFKTKYIICTLAAIGIGFFLHDLFVRKQWRKKWKKKFQKEIY